MVRKIKFENALLCQIRTGNLDECVRNGGSLVAPGIWTSPHKPGGWGGILYGGLVNLEIIPLLVAFAVSPLAPEIKEMTLIYKEMEKEKYAVSESF